jgi:hypothetical protein
VLPQVSATLPGLLQLLRVLTRDSANFKVRTHAAAALGGASGREAYGGGYADALLVTADALEALGPRDGSGSTFTAADGDDAAIGGGSAASPGLPCADVAPASTSAPASAADNGEEEGHFPNVHYLPGLQQQLARSLLRLLALALPADAARLREPLQRRRGVIAAAFAAVGGGGVRSLPQLVAGCGGDGLLPVDPFGQAALCTHQQQHVTVAAPARQRGPGVATALPAVAATAAGAADGTAAVESEALATDALGVAALQGLKTLGVMMTA